MALLGIYSFFYISLLLPALIHNNLRLFFAALWSSRPIFHSKLLPDSWGRANHGK